MAKPFRRMNSWSRVVSGSAKEAGMYTGRDHGPIPGVSLAADHFMGSQAEGRCKAHP